MTAKIDANPHNMTDTELNEFAQVLSDFFNYVNDEVQARESQRNRDFDALRLHRQLQKNSFENLPQWARWK